MNLAKIKAIELKNKRRILEICPNVTEESGIYIFTREEGGFKYAYVGQAKNLLQRLASHLSGYSHIDLSIKKHGFYRADNPTGWKLEVLVLEPHHLDETEQLYIRAYATRGYQMRNKTAGGQGEGKTAIAEFKPAKGYYDGLKQGYENARRDVAKWAKWLTVTCDERKRSKDAFNKFNKFLGGNQ
jgi:hypothetical protein